jgi:ribosomal protein S18 acetylase RimI-like enzyme
MEGKIRKAALKDARRIKELYNSSKNLWYRNSKEDKYDFKEIKEYIVSRKNKMFIFEIKSKIVGVLLAEFHSDYTYLHTLVVDRDYRHKGIGKALMNKLEEESRKNKFLTIEAITEEKDIPMQKLFRELDYKKGKKFIAYVKTIINR